MPNPAYVRDELKAMMPVYNEIADAIAGEKKIKAKGEAYLPRPNPTDESIDNRKRYDAYKQRAVFYNVTQRTLAGLVGQVFMRSPVIEVPAALQIVVDDADGTGSSVEQLAKESTKQVLAFDRSGLFIDYPATPPEGVSRLEMETGNIRPTFKTYGPTDIINWRWMRRGAKEIVEMVVLKEKHKVFDDGFEVKHEDQLRELRLVGNVYTVQIWRKNENAVYQIAEGPYIPTDASGNAFDELPFKFIDSNKNELNPQMPIMHSLASLNIAHYRNSADYEELVYIVGQPTVWASGLTQEWVDKVLKGSLAMGSRGGIPLPENGSAGLLQVQPNTSAFEAMQHKERQMVALGAKIVQEATVQRTATEAGIESIAEDSILSATAKNVSQAYQWALEWAALFVGVPDTGIVCELNTDFEIARMQPAERAQLIKEWQGGAISFEEMRAGLRKAGVATLADDEALTAIDQEQQKAIELEARRIEATTPAEPAVSVG